MEISIAVRNLVRDAKRTLNVNGDGKEASEALQNVFQLLPFSVVNNEKEVCSSSLPGINAQDMNIAQVEFLKNEYVNWLNFLISHYTVELVHILPPGTIQKYFDPFFLNGTFDEALVCLCDALANSTGVRTGKCDSLLHILIKEHLHTLLIDKCKVMQSKSTQGYHDDTKSHLIQLIVSLPDRMTSKLQHQTTAFFFPDCYVQHVSKVITSVLSVVHSRLQAGENCSLDFVSGLVGKLCSVGYGSQICSSLVAAIHMHSQNDISWGRLAERIISGIPDITLESALVSSTLQH